MEFFLTEHADDLIFGGAGLAIVVVIVWIRYRRAKRPPPAATGQSQVVQANSTAVQAGRDVIIGERLEGKTASPPESADENLKRQYYLQDLRRQRELLLEYFGKPHSEFTTLHGVGHTWGEEWRRAKARSVSDWVETNRPYFPDDVQAALTGFAGLAGTMVVKKGFDVARSTEGAKATQEWTDVLKDYLARISNELMEGA